MEHSSATWDPAVQEKFNQMTAKIPPFLRPIAQSKVLKKAETLALKEHRTIVSEKDLVDAFFEETPFGFHGPMKTDMLELNIDYTKYGHPK